MKQADNNVDELGAILERVKNINTLAMAEYDFRYGDGSGNTQYEMVKLKTIIDDGMKTAKRQIEDFYRNKILEAKNETLDALENHKKTLDYIVKDGAPRNPTNYEVYMRKALEVDTKIADITSELLTKLGLDTNDE